MIGVGITVDMEKLVKKIKSIVCEECCDGGYTECRYDVCDMYATTKSPKSIRRKSGVR